MGTTTITEAKNKLSALIDRVQAGESIVILERGRPVARLEPITRSRRSDRDAWQGSSGQGSSSTGSAPPPLERLRRPGARLPQGVEPGRRPSRGATFGPMRFWDSSALCPCWSRKLPRQCVQLEFERDPAARCLVGAPQLECVSALAAPRTRWQPVGAVAGRRTGSARCRSRWLGAKSSRSSGSDRSRRACLRVHPLRAADALQLAAAIVAAEDQPADLPFVTLDDRLALAAEREGFTVVRPDGPPDRGDTASGSLRRAPLPLGRANRHRRRHAATTDQGRRALAGPARATRGDPRRHRPALRRRAGRQLLSRAGAGPAGSRVGGRRWHPCRADGGDAGRPRANPDRS